MSFPEFSTSNLPIQYLLHLLRQISYVPNLQKGAAKPTTAEWYTNIIQSSPNQPLGGTIAEWETAKVLGREGHDIIAKQEHWWSGKQMMIKKIFHLIHLHFWLLLLCFNCPVPISHHPTHYKEVNRSAGKFTANIFWWWRLVGHAIQWVLPLLLHRYRHCWGPPSPAGQQDCNTNRGLHKMDLRHEIQQMESRTFSL